MTTLKLQDAFINSNPVNIESRFVEFDGFFDIFNVNIEEDNSPCGSKCNTLEYTVTMTVNDGILRFNPSLDKAVITVVQDTTDSDGGYVIEFTGLLEEVN